MNKSDEKILIKEIYKELLSSHGEYDYIDRLFLSLSRLFSSLTDRDLSLTVDYDDNVDWQDSASDDGLLYPLVTRTYQLRLADELVCEWDHTWGAELISHSHLGVDAEWQCLDLDSTNYDVEGVLEGIGFDLDEPDVPDPCEADKIE
jgi:hypothetical protein